MTREEYYKLGSRKRIPYEEWCKYSLPTPKKGFINPVVEPPKPKEPKLEDFSRQKELYKQANDLPTSRFEKFKRDNNLPDEIDLRC